MEQAERMERLAVDIDTRLTDVWLIVLDRDSALVRAVEQDDDVRDALGACLRAAYARGYVDALKEDRAGRRAELHRTHGYQPE